MSGESGFSYIWNDDSGTKLSEEDYFTIVSPGKYYITATDSKGCSSIRSLNVYKTEKSQITGFSVAPNPAHDSRTGVRIQLSQVDDVNVTLTSISGQILYKTKLSGDNFYSFTLSLPDVELMLLSLECNGDKKSFKIFNTKQ